MTSEVETRFLPAVVRATYSGEFKVHLCFNDGLEAIVDFAEWLRDGAIFEPLRDTRYFQRFFIEAGTLTWPNGTDIAPETLYERARSDSAA